MYAVSKPVTIDSDPCNFDLAVGNQYHPLIGRTARLSIGSRGTFAYESTSRIVTFTLLTRTRQQRVVDSTQPGPVLILFLEKSYSDRSMKNAESHAIRNVLAERGKLYFGTAGAI
jgi:hypothetical protein